MFLPFRPAFIQVVDVRDTEEAASLYAAMTSNGRVKMSTIMAMDRYAEKHPSIVDVQSRVLA